MTDASRKGGWWRGGAERTLMDYIRASELGYCRRICSGALLYGSPFQAGSTAADTPAGNEGNAIKY